jgi:hypothetical protein
MPQTRFQLDKARLYAYLVAWCLYALVAVGVTYPLILEFTRSAIGDPANDVWNHLWGFWWIKDELVHHHRFPLETTLLNHPKGGTLFFIDMSNALFSLPYQLLFGLTAAYNITILFHLTLNAFGAFLLAFHLTRNPYASFVTGIIYGFSPHLLAQTYNGISETINAGWLPIFILFLFRTFQEARISNAILAGLFLFLTTFANWYYGLFGGLFAGLFLIAQLASSWRRVINPSMFRRLLYLALTYGVLIVPFLSLFAYTLSAENALVGRDPDFVYQTLIRHNMTDLLIFFHPGRFYSPDLKALYGEDLIIVAYLGYSTILLSLLPFFIGRGGRDVRFWGFLAAIFLVFSLGPFLYVDGEYVEIGGRWVPLPFLAFFRAFPLFSRISHAFRFVVMAMLAMGVLAAFGLKGLYARSSGRLPSILGTGAVCGVILAEFLYASPAVFPIPRSPTTVPHFFQELAEEDGSYAVLDLPLGVPTLKRAVYTFGQTVHHKAVPYGLNDPFPANLSGNYFIRYLVNLEFVGMNTLPPQLPTLDLMASIELMKAQRYRYILVHDDLFFNQAQSVRVHRVLRWFFGTPEQYPNDHLSVYRMR